MNKQLSVVIVVLQGREKLARCLSALAQQTDGVELEIVVPYDDTYPDLPAVQEQFPHIQLVHKNGRGTYAEMRTLGIRQTGGDVVAITEDHCIPTPGWAAAILQAHQGPHAAVGGPVDKYTPDTPLNWSLYFADYVRYAMPIPAGETHELTDCNVTYKRSKLDAVAEVWQTEFHEPEVHGALAAQGDSLWFAPDVLVWQQRSMRLGEAVRDRFLFGRLFGGRRAMAAGLVQRLVYVATSAALPFLLVARVIGHVRRKGRYTADLLRALPFVILLNSTWALGEFVGYLTADPGELKT